MARSAEHPTPDFGSGHDLTVQESEPHVTLCADSGEPAWDFVCLSLSPSVFLGQGPVFLPLFASCFK